MVGEAMRILRSIHGVNLLVMSERIDVSPGYLSEIECGKKQPSLELIAKYAEAFDMKPSAILFFAEELNAKGVKERLKGSSRDALMSLLKKLEE